MSVYDYIPYKKPEKRPPTSSEVILRNRFRKFAPIIILILVLLIIAAASFYTLNNGEEAVITRLGRHIRTETTSGLKVKIPFIDTAHIVNVQNVRRMEFGSYEINGMYVDIPEEAIMLTGEPGASNGLVNADWVIQYRVFNSYDYLFKVDDPEQTLHSITQAAYRRVTASRPLNDILTDKKEDMQREIIADLQDICNKYQMGIEITAVQLQDASPPEEVRAAFLDVTMALEDRIARTNEADRYRNEREPLARGEAVAAVNDAEAYKERRINEAVGAAARYKAIEGEYIDQPAIMRTRLYLEMIREVLPNIDKVYFVDQSSGNLLEVLNLGGPMS